MMILLYLNYCLINIKLSTVWNLCYSIYYQFSLNLTLHTGIERYRLLKTLNTILLNFYRSYFSGVMIYNGKIKIDRLRNLTCVHYFFNGYVTIKNCNANGTESHSRIKFYSKINNFCFKNINMSDNLVLFFIV